MQDSAPNLALRGRNSARSWPGFPRQCSELRRKGVTVLGEAPWDSEVWREPLVIDAWAGLAAGRTEALLLASPP